MTRSGTSFAHSKAESGKLELQEGALEIGSTVNACVGMLRNSISEKQLVLEVKIPDSTPVLLGDERKIRQMLLNLLSNAIKFSVIGGTLTIEYCPTKEGGVGLAVSDTWIGITEEDQKRIFEPFTQIDSVYTRTQTGTSPGLSIVIALAHLHNGDVHIDSRLGEGTTITLLFPPERVQYDSRIARTADQSDTI
jgi:signal transduction histidine kinase